MSHKTAHDSVHFYMRDVASRVVARTGIPTDIYHLGKLIFQSFQDDPDFISQIDGATGERETSGSLWSRSVRCGVALQRLGVRRGDVVALLGPNHLHLTVPHYAALYLGLPLAAIDETLILNELRDILAVLKPKIIFCQSEKSADIVKALQLLSLQATIVTFNEGSEHTTLTEFLNSADDEAVKDFQPADFDPAVTTAYLTSTSGTTGVPKSAILTHKNICVSFPYLWQFFSTFPTPTRLVLVLSPAQWLSAGFHFVFSPIIRVTRLQTSAPVDPDHFAYLINTYKPTFTTISPVLMTSLLAASDHCDLSCFECIAMGGSAVPGQLIRRLQVLTKTPHVYGMYGMSEVSGLAFHHDYPPPPGSAGSARGFLQYRLVDHSTNEDITEPNVPGELWMKGPTVFKGYYNNPEVTAETLTADGWLKTGDIFYRDQYWHFYFVERMKSLLKYMNHQIAPAEVEAVIRSHPGVSDVVVTGVPDSERGDLVVACVVPHPGASPSADQIKQLVKDNLTDSKQLRGGVIFMKQFPLTSTSKINRKKLRDLVCTMDRE